MKLFFADTETTGLDHVNNEIFQLAFIIEIDGEVAEERSIRMAPVRTEYISEEALAVTKKTREEILAYPPKRKGYDELIRILRKHVDRFDKKDKMIWIGQNPDFDVRFLRNFFKEMGDNYFGSWWDRRPADLISLAVAAKTKGLVDPPDFKLGSLAKEFGITFDAHDALEDVRVTRRVWQKISGFLRPPREAKTRMDPSLPGF